MNTNKPVVLSIGLLIVLAMVSCKHANPEQSQQAPIIQPADVPAMYAKLIDSASRVRNHAYAPYSKFLAGSAVLAESGTIYTGCNVENASYGLTNCAERTAIFKAIAAGERKIKAIAIVADVPEFDAPCGACRQVIFEFGKDIDVVMANLSGKHKIEKISALLPYAFGPGSF